MSRIMIHLGSVLLLFNLIFSFTYDIQAKSIELKKTEYSNYETIEYGNEDHLSSLIKKQIQNKVSVVSQPTKVKDENDKHLYQIEEFIMEVEYNQTLLGKQKAMLTVYYQNLEWLKQDVYLLIVDTQAPQIALTQQYVEISENDAFDASNYVASIHDNYDDHPKLKIQTDLKKQGDKYLEGTYEVRYRVSDCSFNVSEASLQVKVNKQSQPVLHLESDNTMVNHALSLLGKPYVWGGKGPNGFDCSGIIMYLYSLQGYVLPWSSIAYGSGMSISLDESAWEIGDVLSYSNSNQNIVHHALYLGNHQVLHAMVDGVRIVDIDQPLHASDQKPMTLVRVNRFL